MANRKIIVSYVYIVKIHSALQCTAIIVPSRSENRNKSKINWLGFDDYVPGFDFCDSDYPVLCNQEKATHLLQKEEIQNICLQIQGMNSFKISNKL